MGFASLHGSLLYPFVVSTTFVLLNFLLAFQKNMPSMDSIFQSISQLTLQVKQFVQGSASSSSSSETGLEISDILHDLQSVTRTSAWIKAVLADAEERAVCGEELVKLWLTDLHRLNYRAADLLGLYEYEVAAQQIRDEEASATAAAAAKGKRKLNQVYNSSPLTDPSFRQEFALGIREFRKDFDEINKLKEDLRFDKEDGEKTKQRGADMLERLPTGSEPVDDLFFGREDKLRELMGYLLADSIEVENDQNSKYVPVIALVGMGGVGKTTLAQHAFNDPKVCEFYSRRGWVCVSDNFHVPRVTRLTLEAFNERSNDKEEFNALQKRLKAVVKETKFLLVLDDVWNEDVAIWDTFYSSLRDGAKGSKIIITTRSKTVADIAQAMNCIDVSCLSNEDDLIFGRDADMRELIGYLLTDGIEVENDTNCKRVPVIALVGMGGVGKTTLAQHAFNDPKVCELYSRRGWVCVSDNFHVQRLTRSTLEALNESSHDEEFSALQTRLKDVAKKSKFLLVLDDVWNEDVEPWDTFYSSLRAGAKGSKIIITTRSQTVAGIAQAMKCIDVSCLSDEDAWNFFLKVVFGDHGKQHELDHPELTNVGKKITERCKGLPLAIKVLGRYLRGHNKDVYIWDEVLESKLLQPHVFGEVNQVLGPLILSYLYLPARVKPCFVLSCVFPKDQKIRKEELIDLWIAHELVEDGNENTGMLYIENLVARSFFEIHKHNKEEYLMIHDIIHDLAMHLSRDKIFDMRNRDDQGNNLPTSEEVQHAFISFGYVPAVQLKFGITDTCGLRTLHVEGNTEKLIDDSNPVYLNSLRSLTLHDDVNFSYEYLKRLKNLRHLDLRIRSPVVVTQGEIDAIGTLFNLRTLKIRFVRENGDGISFPVCICNLRQLIHLRINGIRDVPDSIGCLTKLCKLYLEESKIEYLPDTIATLVNLKEMDLSRSRIRCLPKSIGNLKALRVLNLEWCRSLIELPASIGELKALKVLNLVWCSSLIELPASIGELKALKVLNLAWCSSLIELPASIGELKALEVLKLGRCWRLKELPASTGDLKGLKILNLESCCYLIELPASIGELKALEDLDLCGCWSLKELPASTCDLKGLKILNLKLCYSLIKLPASIGELKALEVLNLEGYWALKILPASALKVLPVGIKGLTKLQQLGRFSVAPRELVANEDAAGIAELRELVCIRGSLVIEGLENVATQEEAEQSELNNKRHIRELRLEWTNERPKEERVAQDEEVLQGLRPHANLEKLEIYFWKGRRLASWLGDTSLVNLKVIAMARIPNCESLTPIHQLPSLRYLCCFDMPSLLHLSDSDIRNSCSIPLLKKLELKECGSVRALPPSLPSLKVLHIARCVSLNSILFDNLPALEELVVSDCDSLEFSMDTTVFPSSLRHLKIQECPQPLEWCHTNRQSKLAHLPNGDSIEFSNTEWRGYTELSDEEESSDFNELSITDWMRDTEESSDQSRDEEESSDQSRDEEEWSDDIRLASPWRC